MKALIGRHLLTITVSNLERRTLFKGPQLYVQTGGLCSCAKDMFKSEQKEK